MKTQLLYILFFKLISVFSIVPLWNFKNSAINLLSNSDIYTYVICDRESYNMKIKLEKTITKGTTISETNRIYIDEKDRGETNWEDIESFYKINNIKYICPKGKYFMYIDSDDSFKEMIPKDFTDEGDWELKCYYQSQEGYMFVTFLNKYSTIYVYYLDGSNKWDNNLKIHQGLYDYKWTTQMENDNHDYLMKGIILKDNNIFLQSIMFNIKSDHLDKNDVGSNKQLFQSLSYSNSYFNLYNYNFYFMTYNSISVFTSGYYNGSEEITMENIGKIKVSLNNGTPLEFIDNNISIKYLNFIRNTKYIFYKLQNNKNNEIYHGIIDIQLNKVIFNTNETILEFKPYSNISMLAITENSAYKICALKNELGDDCIESCSGNENIILDSENSNKCGSKCKTKYILIPDQICLDSCNENIYTINGNQCGLCRDIGLDNKIYKLINTSGCLEQIPEAAEYYNEKLKLLTCKEGYNLIDGKCSRIPSSICHGLCESCYEFSLKDDDQKCISCKAGYLLQEGNCIKSCTEGYFQIEKKCEKCHKLCKSCFENFNKCNSCIDGTYLNISNNSCLNCSENCKTCSNMEQNGNHNCLSCDQSSKFKYLIDDENNKTCVENCPNNTFLIKDNLTCAHQKERESNSSTPENSDIKKKHNPNFILWFFIILIIITILIMSLCICKKYCNKQRSEQTIIDQIREMEDKEIFD